MQNPPETTDNQTLADRRTLRRQSLASPERRSFMRALLISAGAGLATACAPRSVPGPQPIWSESTPNVVLPSPQPPARAASTPAPARELLASFLALSVLLTGMDEAANPTLGQTYLQALQADGELEVPIDTFLERASYVNGAGPQDLDALRATGVLDDEATRTVANRIVNHWYSGTYVNADGDLVVATFVDALAWKSLAITKPLTICTYFGAWAMRPQDAPAILPLPAHLDALQADG